MAKERERPDVAQERLEWEKWQKDSDCRRIICLDESSVKTNYIPLRGWSARGKRCVDVAPGSWKTYTMLSYLNYEGKTDGLIFPGAVNKEIFREFMEEILLPATKAGDIVILDNLNVHKNSYNKRLFELKGVKIKYIPRYSPEFNPIEMLWSKVKSDLRKAKPRDFYDIWRESSCSKLDVTPENAHRWYMACGYCH